MQKVHYSSSKDDWETPSEVFTELTKGYSVTLDVCATKETRKVQSYLYAKSLEVPWLPFGPVCWMNPPYGRQIGKWIAKAASEAKDSALTIIALLPARTDTVWWHEYIQPILDGKIPGKVKFLRGRIKFVGAKHSALFPSVCVIWNP